jgi:hypothetical protein
LSDKTTSPQSSTPRRSSRMPGNSVFFEKIVPVLLVVMGIVMIGLVVFAAGILLGFIKF